MDVLERAHAGSRGRHDLIIELRSVTAGAGGFEAKFDYYVELTGKLAEQVAADHRVESRVRQESSCSAEASGLRAAFPYFSGSRSRLRGRSDSAASAVLPLAPPVETIFQKGEPNFDKFFAQI